MWIVLFFLSCLVFVASLIMRLVFAFTKNHNTKKVVTAMIVSMLVGIVALWGIGTMPDALETPIDESLEVAALPLTLTPNAGIIVPELREQVTPVDPFDISVDGLDYQVIGCAFGSQDSKVDLGLDTESIGMAFAVGVRTGATNLGNKDAMLAIYLSVAPSASIVSPRDVASASLEVAVVDDRGDSGKFIINTLNGVSPTIGSASFGMALFGVYSDSAYFDISLDDTVVRLYTDSVPYLSNNE